MMSCAADARPLRLYSTLKLLKTAARLLLHSWSSNVTVTQLYTEVV